MRSAKGPAYWLATSCLLHVVSAPSTVACFELNQFQNGSSRYYFLEKRATIPASLSLTGMQQEHPAGGFCGYLDRYWTATSSVQIVQEDQTTRCAVQVSRIHCAFLFSFTLSLFLVYLHPLLSSISRHSLVMLWPVQRAFEWLACSLLAYHCQTMHSSKSSSTFLITLWSWTGNTIRRITSNIPNFSGLVKVKTPWLANTWFQEGSVWGRDQGFSGCFSYRLAWRTSWIYHILQRSATSN